MINDVVVWSNANVPLVSAEILLAKHVCRCVGNGSPMRRMCPKQDQGPQRTSYLKLFPASTPLEYVSIDILGPLPKTAHGNRFLLVMTDRFSKLTRTVPLRTTTALVTAKAFCEHWVFCYGPPRYVLSDNGPQFAAKFFQAVCRELGIEKVFSSAYHPQTNGQVERFNRTILNSLRGYLAERQGDWDEYTAALTFGYNCRIHTSLGLAPFELVLSRPPPPLSVETPESGNEDTPETVKMCLLQQLRNLLPVARERLAEAQGRYKRNYDRHVRPKNDSIPPDSWVYIRKETHNTEVNPKLDKQVEGPYQVCRNDGHTMLLRIGDDLVQVNSDRITPAPTPSKSGIVRQESASPLSKTPSGGSIAGPPQREDQEYVVDRIVGARQMPDGSLRCKIRWFGYQPNEDTWEPQENLPKTLVRRYHKKTGLPLPQRK